MKINGWFGVVLAAAMVVVAQPLAANADEETKVESSDGKYKEIYKGDNGATMEYERDGHKAKKEYKDGSGVVVKEESDGNTFKKVYEDKNCKEETVQEVKDGETVTVTKGNCGD